MALKNYEDLNDMQKDVLREIGNIGSGNAASAISSMIDRPIKIGVPRINILDYNEAVKQLGGPEVLIVGLMLSMSGDVNGMMMFLLHKDFAHMMINTLLGSNVKEFSQIDEMGRSAIQEVGNIMASSYVNAIASLTGLNINISVPDLCIDMVGSILSVPAIHYANISENVILVEDEFSSQDENASSHLIMVPDVDSLNKIMTNLGIEI